MKGLFEKKGKGSYTIQFRRGSYFEKPQATKAPAAESAIYEPLRAIGFEDAAIARIVTKYRPELIQTWADITLAAKEKHGVGLLQAKPASLLPGQPQEGGRGQPYAARLVARYRKEEDRRERESKRHVLGLLFPSMPRKPRRTRIRPLRSISGARPARRCRLSWSRR